MTTVRRTLGIAFLAAIGLLLIAWSIASAPAQSPAPTNPVVVESPTWYPPALPLTPEQP